MELQLPFLVLAPGLQAVIFLVHRGHGLALGGNVEAQLLRFGGDGQPAALGGQQAFFSLLQARVQLGDLVVGFGEHLHGHADLQIVGLMLQVQELLGSFRLLFQRLHPGLQLADDVAHPFQMALSLGQLAAGLGLAVPVFDDARGLLHQGPAFLGSGGDQLVDAALIDEGKALQTHAGVHKQVVDVPEAAGGLVDVVFAAPAPDGAAGDADLGKGQRQVGIGIVQHHGDLGRAQRTAGGGAGEDDVLHAVAPDGTGVAFAQHPADGVGDVALAAAVGAHDAADARLEFDFSFAAERLEAVELDAF